MQFIKKHIGPIYISLMTVVIAVWLICSDELHDVVRMLEHLDRRYVCAAAGCILLYLFLRVAALRFYIVRQGYAISWRDAVCVTGTGQFYSAITPSASGGQPMQVLRFRRMGVPVSVGTACISIKFVGFQAGFVVLGLVTALFRLPFLNSQLYGWRWLTCIGYVVNGGLCALVLATIPRLGIVERIASAGIRLGAKLRLVKDQDAANRKFDQVFSEYRQALLSLKRHPVDAAVLFLLSLLQVLSYMSVVVCVYHAFRLTGCDWFTLLTVQLQLFVAAAFIPLPGSAGAQESGFVLFFHGIFPADGMTAAMLLWRFFTYYFLLLAGFVMMAAGMGKKAN